MQGTALQLALAFASVYLAMGAAMLIAFGLRDHIELARRRFIAARHRLPSLGFERCAAVLASLVIIATWPRLLGR